MKKRNLCWRYWTGWVLLLGLCGGGALASPSSRPKKTRKGASPGAALLLQVQAAKKGLSVKEALRPDHAFWRKVPAQSLHLNHTPPLYAGQGKKTAPATRARVRLLRWSNGLLVVRLRWKDATPDRGSSPRRYPTGGSKHIYKRHSHRVSRYTDATCVMVPQKRGAHARYPSLVMGEKKHPVDLYYWQATRGFQHLSARGRGTTTRTSRKVRGQARREGQHWLVTFALPALPPQTPLCFAFWDGSRQHRDGLKQFSLWYQLP